MFKVEMTFMIPDESIRFEKHALLVNESEPEDEFKILSTISLAEDPETRTEKIEDSEYTRTDPLPHLPNTIDGAAYKGLTENEQDFYCLVDGEYLFDFWDSSEINPKSDETPFGDWTEKDWGVA